MANDGWHDLPGGGSIEIKSGIPTRISDKGRWDLDENQLLEEASEYARMKLAWKNLDRSGRWRRVGLTRFLLGLDDGRWRFAAVLRAGCDICGNDIGVQWIQVTGECFPSWVCASCVLGPE